MADQKTLLDYVQEHERSWGTETYLKRPSLQEILQAPVVAFWHVHKQTRLIVTLHSDVQEIENHLTRQLFRSEVTESKQKLSRIFRNGKRIRIKTVRIEFEDAE